MPFIPQLDGLSDYRRGRLGHRGVTAPAQFRRREDARDHVGPKTSADPPGSEASRLPIVMKDIHRQLALESSTDANSPREDSANRRPSVFRFASVIRNILNEHHDPQPLQRPWSHGRRKPSRPPIRRVTRLAYGFCRYLVAPVIDHDGNF
jgi:hypothetical protein